MGEVKNAFIKSKMNKDLDARLVPSGEYRNAVNAQVSKSDSADVGALENVLGNIELLDFGSITGVSGLTCIGYLSDDSTSNMYLFFTNYTDSVPVLNTYDPAAKNFIFQYNTLNNTYKLLVEGAFLNFSKTNIIYGVNLVEELLFWTDNRNQPRKINIQTANDGGLTNPTYYTTEDQISVAKYNPYQAMEMYAVSEKSNEVVTQYETTMKDVTSINMPNGGSGKVVSSTASSVVLSGFKGQAVVATSVYGALGASVSYVDNGEIIEIIGATVDTAVFNEINNTWAIAIIGTLPGLTLNQVIVLNANPYYNSNFAGDENYLEDKFVRFGYRFKFDDGEYSIFSTFTQAAFIPKQDGYFMYVKEDGVKEVDDLSNAYRSTVVSFLENKVDEIKLRIPLPFKNYEIEDQLKIKELDIIYKESDGLAVKVVDTIDVSTINNSASSSLTSAASVASLDILVNNVEGVINVGEKVTGNGIVGEPVVVSYTPSDPNNSPSTSGTITLDTVQTVADNVSIIVGELDYYVYSYDSMKPYKTLPSSEIIRVYDKVPVKALSQELISNRVVYGNYQDKHNPPTSLDYNVLASTKSSFNLQGGYGAVAVVVSSNSLELSSLTGNVAVGSTVTSSTILTNVVVQSIVGSLLTLTGNVSVSVGDILTFTASSGVENNTSVIEYPSSSLKGNRTYQVGVVLSDRFGRQSTTLLSNNLDVTKVGGISYSGSTIFVPYIEENINPGEWLGNSIKVLFNKTMGTTGNGVYNGDSASADYKPLGWYSLKIVVKQTEQEYYNVYLPGIMASYPEDTTLEIGKTSHAVLINDNINKVPRDLSEIGPDQKQFRSSVRLFGRVDNSGEEVTVLNPGQGSKQYYTDNTSDTVTTISTVNDLFNYKAATPPEPNFFPQFYSLESNPLIARISTDSKIGQIASRNYNASSGTAALNGTTDLIRLVNVSGDPTGIAIGDHVVGPGFPSDLKVDNGGYTAGLAGPTVVTQAATTSNTVEYSFNAGVQVGMLIAGVGVPDGTVILELLVTPARMVVSNIVSVNNGINIGTFNPSTLDVDSSVAITQGSIIQINSAGTPSIQQLAVYETEPVASLLDIFWETSTTGLVSDINYLIINATDGVGAAGISEFTVPDFTEALWSTGIFPRVFPNINTGNIYLIDSFGQAVPSSNIEAPLSISSVVNGDGTNVQASNPTGPYFQLVETSAGSYEYDIITTAAYEEDVYYGSSANAYIFTINFQATVSGLTSVFSKTISLQNEPPFIMKPSGEFAPPYTEPILLEINNTTTQNIATLGGSNGSGGTTVNILNPPPNSTAELTWDKISEVNSSGQTSDHFSVDEFTGLITNDDYSDPTMPAEKYTINVELADPGLEVTRDVIINTGLGVEIYGEWILTDLSSGSPGTTWTYFFVNVLDPTFTLFPNAGIYCYQFGSQSVAGPWATLISNTGGNTIELVTGNVGRSGCDAWRGAWLNTFASFRAELVLSGCVSPNGLTMTNWAWAQNATPLNPDPIGYNWELDV